MSLVSPAKALPLEPFDLAILPKTTHNIAWSPDNELAIGCDDCVLVYVPDFSLSSSLSSSSSHVNGNGAHGANGKGPGFDGGSRQYGEAALRFPIAPLKSPELNRHLFDAAPAGPAFAGYTFFTGGGDGIITGHGSTLNHAVALAWSPCGLGRMSRSVLAVLTAAGIVTVYCQGASDAVESSATGTQGRTMQPWVAAWHVGGGLLVPTAEGHTSPNKKEYITAVSWARDTNTGVAVLSYMNSDNEAVLLSVQAKHDPNATPGHPGIWGVQEVARFTAEGPHPVPTDATDPDYVYSTSSFALGWSPWLDTGASRTSMLSYVSHNYIGFRQITLGSSRDGPESPQVSVSQTDASGVCLYLSTDAFVVWEDQVLKSDGFNICRGVIASPMKVQAFELPFDRCSPSTRHSTNECETTYPTEEDIIHMENPITGLIIHPPSFSHDASIPLYTLVRLSATHDNPAWHQTNLIPPPDADGGPAYDGSNNTRLRWATEISQIVEHQLPRALAHRQGNAGGEKGRGHDGGGETVTGFGSEDEFDTDDDLESDSDFDSEDEDDEDEDGDDDGDAAIRRDVFGIRGVDTEDQVHLQRVRIWGLAASPGGGTSAVFVSLHSTLELERDTFAGLRCRVLFGVHPHPYPHHPAAHHATAAAARRAEEERTLSTEAAAWEWMYAAGPPVPGFTAPARCASPGDGRAALREHFDIVARRQLCVFCDAPLAAAAGGNTSRCGNGHLFENCANTGVPITAPNVSHTCGVCGMKCLKSEELIRLAPQLRGVIEGDISPELCGGCGGKFTI
ncbi:putative gpi-anchor transamidase-like protein [Rosellinia necatrix]|uniref:Putative gpi-anchor transamidase-like protein n=1 Tax=Rosellinia necatrix TaxID=77044 RepID=A0A1W2TL84_ROSNE|nr:putative gpi-anchor transamidase-like protein [Rosellinia necatrix]